MTDSNASNIKNANSTLLVDGNLDAIGEFFADDYIVHITDGDFAGGPALVRQSLGLYLKAFSERQVEVQVLVESEDRIAWQRTVRAMHNGSFKGFPASGRPIVWRDMVVSRIRGGLIAEEWLTTDLAERLLLERHR